MIKATTIYACHYCRREIPNIQSKNIAVLVQGWVTHRSGGGTHHIKKQRKLGPVAHLSCIDIEFDPASQMNEMFPND